LVAAFIIKKTSSKILLPLPLVFLTIGISSFFYHASATFIGQFFDFFSIYILGSILLFFSAKPSKILGNKILLTITIVTIFLGLLLWFVPSLRIPIAFIEPFIVLALERKNKSKYQIDYKYFTTAIKIFIFAFIIWLSDLYMVWDIDWLEHYVNGHAIWHILTSISLWFVFKHYITNIKIYDLNH
jgi:hypothetical protein